MFGNAVEIRIWTSASVHRDPISQSNTNNGCTERLLRHKTKWKHIHKPQNTRHRRAPGKKQQIREKSWGVWCSREVERQTEIRDTFQYTCVHYNMRVMWSNHGKETARHRFRVLSSSPAYWPNGVALKTQTGEKNRVNNDRERERSR